MKSKKLIPLFIIVGLIITGCTATANKKTEEQEKTHIESSTPLLSQLETEYGITIPEIQAAGGSAVGNIVLENYLPVEGNQRFTDIVNSQNGEKNTLEEITINTPSNGEYSYSLYNRLAEYTLQGVLFPDDSGKLYYKKQENMLDTSIADMDIYIGIPGENWTLKIKKNNSEKHFTIAPEFYTITTPYGVYENCLLKYMKDSDDSIVISGYAPNGMGKVIEVGWLNPKENKEASLYYYTYCPDDIPIAENSVITDMPDNSMIIADLLDDEGAEFWTNGNEEDSFTLTMRTEEVGTHLYMFNPFTYEMPYSGLIFDSLQQENSVMGDPGCSEGKLTFLSDGELELSIRDDIYTFYKN